MGKAAWMCLHVGAGGGTCHCFWELLEAWLGVNVAVNIFMDITRKANHPFLKTRYKFQENGLKSLQKSPEQTSQGACKCLFGECEGAELDIKLLTDSLTLLFTPLQPPKHEQSVILK
ncbi:hypothetical protein UY3_00793 [Chelonia mydas]|uniref:Uncharacterized protein n=1 Tax=Chelonia mydas TaxID=8469 RepID=M7CLA4_CHEMY|nr:hypothetical protein UY3_00793 [Chelonia mydas]